MTTHVTTKVNLNDVEVALKKVRGDYNESLSLVDLANALHSEANRLEQLQKDFGGFSDEQVLIQNLRNLGVAVSKVASSR